MTTDRDRHLANLSTAELLMYVAGGGELVTRLMEVQYRRACRDVGLTVAPTQEDLAKLVAEGLPRPRVKPPKPLVYRRRYWDGEDTARKARERSKALARWKKRRAA